mmetsp:Transcript_1067/g.2117  ORF Transcript_1067/g.2117 Transcript_1067/m.2117 type:complete len:512 (-) Transcript_1067:49-1584(-)
MEEILEDQVVDGLSPLLRETAGREDDNSDAGDEMEDDLTWWHTYKSSFVVYIAVCLVDSLEYGVIMPSLFTYLRSLDRGTSSEYQINFQYGYIMASFSFASLILKPVLGYLADHRPFLETMVWSTMLAMTGNLLYFFTEFLTRGESGPQAVFPLLLAARLMAGAGTANTSLSFAFVARTVPSKNRTKFIGSISLIRVMGFLLGPAMNVITSVMNFHIGEIEVNPNNSPGLLIFIINIPLLILMAVFLTEPPPYVEDNTQAQLTAQNRLRNTTKYCSFPLALCFANILVFNFLIGCLEAVIVPATSVAFNWTPLQNSYVYLGITGLATVSSITVISCSHRIEDRTFLMIAAAVGVVATSAMRLGYYYDMSVLQFWAASLLMALPVSLGFPTNRSIFSRLIEGSTSQAFLSSALSVFGSLGSMLGPYWAAVGLGERPEKRVHERIASLAVTGCIIITSTLAIANFLVLFVLKTDEPILNGSTRVVPIESDLEYQPLAGEQIGGHAQEQQRRPH